MFIFERNLLCVYVSFFEPIDQGVGLCFLHLLVPFVGRLGHLTIVVENGAEMNRDHVKLQAHDGTCVFLLMVVFVVSSIACFDWLRPNFLRWCLPRIVGIAGSRQPPQRMLTQITKIPSES